MLIKVFSDRHIDGQTDVNRRKQKRNMKPYHSYMSMLQQQQKQKQDRQTDRKKERTKERKKGLETNPGNH